jgi:hypothetical protein
MSADESMDLETARLLRGYQEMAQDAEQEAEAIEWSEALIADAAGEDR